MTTFPISCLWLALALWILFLLKSQGWSGFFLVIYVLVILPSDWVAVANRAVHLKSERGEYTWEPVVWILIPALLIIGHEVLKGRYARK